ncbi:MAG: 2-dehydropantoate 2-reductase [Burkholderiales bacterium]
MAMGNSKRMAFMGTGALGGYVGGYFAHHGQDVTLIDFWPENIEAIRSRGLELDGVTDEEKFTVRSAKTLHYTDLATLAGQPPFDIIFITVKSYDTERVTRAVAPYLAKDGYMVSLQNCWNEDSIAAIVGKARTVGTIASMISVELYGPGRVRRMAEKGGGKHTVFRIGEIDGQITDRVNELVKLFSLIDSSKATANLQGERWTKLTQNGMSNGICAATGLTGHGCDNNDAIRRFAIQVAGESIRVGRALGLKLEKMGPLMPDQLEKASAGDPVVLAEVEQILKNRKAANPRANIQRPSMAQDMEKGRKTEIEFMNGLIVAKGKSIGIPTPANEKLVQAVLSVEQGKVKASAAVLGG